MTHEQTSDDDDLDDPLLRALAEAPPIALGEPWLPAGTVIDGGYRLHRVLGAGAMGVVYEATDLVLSRRVAIKVVEIGSSDRAARLWREARAMARLAHPNVVTVHEVGTDGPRGYIAMELVEGTNARAWARATRRSWQDVVEVYRQAGTGLAVAHEAGIVHRDFKPENVLIGADGRVRVADFGIASQARSVSGELDTQVEREDGVTLTGSTMGTPAYMAPELDGGHPADERSDQFSFCVALSEALCGRRPEREDVRRTGEGSKRADASPEVRLPAWLETVIDRGLAVDPAARYPDMRALVAALDPAPRRRRWMLAGGAVGALVVGTSLLRVGGWLASDESRIQGCAQAGAVVSESWSPSIAASLRAAFEANAPSIAEATAKVTLPEIDAWTRAWRDEAREVCEATRVRGEQSEQRLDARMDCLARARRRLDAVVTLLAEADPATVARADAVVRSLPDISACARSEGVEDELDLPDERLSLTLDRVTAEAAAGRLVQSRATLDDLIPELEAAGAMRALAEAYRLRGVVLLDMGRRDDAITDLARAATLSVRRGSRDALVRSALDLARATGRTSGGFDEASRWLTIARELAEELGWPEESRARLREAGIEIHFYADHYPEVEREAAAMVEAAQVVPVSVRVRAMTLLATVLQRQGRFDDALAIHDEALALVEETRGPAHPQTAMVLSNRVTLLAALSRHDELQTSLERVLEIRLTVFGDDAPILGETHRQLGDAAAERGDAPAAVRHYEQAIEIHRLAEDDSGAVFALGNLANLRSARGEYEEAGRLIDQALEHAERAFGPRSVRVAQLLINRGRSRMAAHEHARAASELERALSILIEHLSADAMDIAIARIGLAQAYAALGRRDEALAHFDDASRVLLAALPSDNPGRVELARSHADLLQRLGDVEASLELRWETTRIAEALLPERHAARIAAWRDLGSDLLGQQKSREALAALERARVLDETAGDDPARTAAIAELIERAQGSSARAGRSNAVP